SASWNDFHAALQRSVGETVHYQELKDRVADELGDVVDLDDGAWYYKGFRVSASPGKRKLVLEGKPKTVVATIEDIAVFRDAHPEGVYLGHSRLRRQGNWQTPTMSLERGN